MHIHPASPTSSSLFSVQVGQTHCSLFLPTSGYCNSHYLCVKLSPLVLTCLAPSHHSGLSSCVVSSEWSSLTPFKHSSTLHSLHFQTDNLVFLAGFTVCDDLCLPLHGLSPPLECKCPRPSISSVLFTNISPAPKKVFGIAKYAETIY